MTINEVNAVELKTAKHNLVSKMEHVSDSAISSEPENSGWVKNVRFGLEDDIVENKISYGAVFEEHSTDNKFLESHSVSRAKTYSVDAELLNIDQNGNTPLIRSILQGDVEQAKKIISTDPKTIHYINPNRDNALLLSIKEEQTAIALALIHAKANLNYLDKNGDSPLILAAKSGSYSVVEILLKSQKVNFSYINRQGNTPLIMAAAAKEKNLQVVKALMNNKEINIYHVNSKGESALMAALKNNFPEAAMALISANANPNHIDIFGNTALILAVQLGETDAVQALIATRKLNANHTNDNGDSALLLACKGNYTQTALDLVAVGADTNQLDSKGNSALFYAVKHNNLEITQAILNKRLELAEIDIESSQESVNIT